MALFFRNTDFSPSGNMSNNVQLFGDYGLKSVLRLRLRTKVRVTIQ